MKETILAVQQQRIGMQRMASAMFRVLLVFALLAATCPVLAQESSIAVLDNAGNKILALIGAKWVKALLALALVIEFGVIAFGNAQGEGGMIKKVLPWIIGTAGVLGATSIVNFFFSGISQEALSSLTTAVNNITV